MNVPLALLPFFSLIYYTIMFFLFSWAPITMTIYEVFMWVVAAIAITGSIGVSIMTKNDQEEMALRLYTKASQKSNSTLLRKAKSPLLKSLVNFVSLVLGAAFVVIAANQYESERFMAIGLVAMFFSTYILDRFESMIYRYVYDNPSRQKTLNKPD